MSAMEVDLQCFSEFQVHWLEHDPTASHQLHWKVVENVLSNLPFPMGMQQLAALGWLQRGEKGSASWLGRWEAGLRRGGLFEPHYPQGGRAGMDIIVTTLPRWGRGGGC